MVVPPAPAGDGAPATANANGDAPSTPWAPRPWFGGAMRASLPPSFLDASDARPVPDHQEAWHDGRQPGAALIVEIVEHDAAVGDGAAGRHFFADAAEGAGALAAAGAAGAAGVCAFRGRELEAPALPAPGMPGGRPTAAYEGAFVVRGGGQGAEEGAAALAALAAAVGSDSVPGPAPAPAVVAAALAVFRVPRVGSDIVITSFEPAGALGGGDDEAAELAAAGASAAGAAAAAGSAPLAAARGRLARVLATMSVEDWGLFGGGGGGGDGDDEAG